MTSGLDVALRSVALASAVDLDGFRHACRQLWAEQIAPDHVGWHTADDVEGDLFEAVGGGPVVVDGAAGTASAPDGAAPPPVNAPASFLTLAKSVVLHSDPNRFGLLYRLLWRLQTEPGLRRDPLDADWVEAEHMAQAVRRDMHKMKAFVRFRPIADGAGPGVPLHVAWFEPEHHIVEATAPFFARRFTAMQWAILTPERSVRWDGETLTLGPKARRDQAPPSDAGEQLWLTYYRSIFNPARLKLKMMQKEMPRRYWKNLPEAQLIDPLAATAMERSQSMIDRPPTETMRRMPVAAAQPDAGHPVTPGDEAPRTLPALRNALERCRECPIGEHATQAVPGEGPARARLMFVGEQPGDQEDLQGRPFVGPAGQLSREPSRSSASRARTSTSPTPSSISSSSCAASDGSTRRRRSRRPQPACTGSRARSNSSTRRRSSLSARLQRASSWAALSPSRASVDSGSGAAMAAGC